MHSLSEPDIYNIKNNHQKVSVKITLTFDQIILVHFFCKPITYVGTSYAGYL